MRPELVVVGQVVELLGAVGAAVELADRLGGEVLELDASRFGVLWQWARLGQEAYSTSEPPGASVSTRVAGASSAM